MRVWAAVLLLISGLDGAAVRKREGARVRPMEPLPAHLCKVLYVATCINPSLSVLANKYTGVRNFRPLNVLHGSAWQAQSSLTAGVYKTLFYFARLKPRLLFAIGACARALQQTTVLQLVFDPSVGVGAGLNILALLTGSQWPAALVLGCARHPCVQLE